MSIVNNNYELLDSTKANVPDCFVLKNKIGRGHGEAKFYIGGTTLKDWDAFFDNFNIQCLFTKEDLISYLEMAKTEYEEQSQQYNKDISTFWQKRMDEVTALHGDVFFNCYRPFTKDGISYDPKRYYINSNGDIWATFRRLALPIMTSLLIQKIDVGGTRYLWFRPYINEIGNVFENDVIKDFLDKEIEKVETDKTLTETTKLQITKARLKQGLFRDRILEKYDDKCIISQVDDVRILVAGHIKPWSISDNREKLSGENGLLLTPTYDKLFDRGFISFRDNGEIILSDYFSDSNFKILNLKAKTKYNLKATDEMKNYLLYHRETVFIK